MQQYQLQQIYGNLRRALAAGDDPGAARWIGEALGFELPPPAPGQDQETLARQGLQPQLTYRGFKPAELAMLAADLKPVVKLEDIPLDQARAFLDRHGRHYRILVSPPYVKDYLLLRSRPATGAPGPDWLVSLYASRDDAGERLLQLETAERENVVGSGALLGFPACCISAFAADFARSRRDQDTVNDDACRRVLASATATAPGQPLLNPLADLELLGFYACSLHCRPASRLAVRNARALLASRPALGAALQSQLQRPVLFWRLPFFLIFDGFFEGESLVFRAATANAFPEAQARRAQALFAGSLLGWLAAGDRLVVEHGALTLLRGDRRLATLPASSGPGPLLVPFGPWPDGIFDPGATGEQPSV